MNENHGAGVRVCETAGCGFASACWPVEVFGPGRPVKSSEAVYRRRCPWCQKLQGTLPRGYVPVRRARPAPAWVWWLLAAAGLWAALVSMVMDWLR